MHRNSWRLAAAFSMVAAAACRPDFKLKNYTGNDALYAASFSEYQHHRWDNAITGFEKLTTDLSARDTLLPRSYWYLGNAHEKNGERLLAAQAYSRLVESFPDDTLADDAALEAARAYKKMWRKPELDAMYGETALSSYNTLIGLYPTSPLISAAQKDVADLENWFAIKDYDAGMYYFRRKLYISASLYFKDAITKFPNAPQSVVAAERLVEGYKADKYKDDASELCAELHVRYPNDHDVAKVCTGVAPPKVATDTTATPAVKPPPS